MLDLTEIVSLVAVGLATGAVGGLLGIGGSIILIPALTILFRHNMHLAEAAAMIVNVFVAVPSALQHHRAGAVRWGVVARTLPFAVAFILIGVFAGNQFDGVILQKLFGVFLIYVVATNIHRLVAHFGKDKVEPVRTGWWRVGMVGSVLGFMAGLLGIGGGTVTVPLFQRVCHLPLRHCIGLSSAIMCITALFGAAMKNATLGQHEQAMMESFLIAACLAPTAFIGGLIGGRLTHVLPIMHVRIVFLVVLGVAAVRMLI